MNNRYPTMSELIKRPIINQVGNVLSDCEWIMKLTTSEFYNIKNFIYNEYSSEDFSYLSKETYLMSYLRTVEEEYQENKSSKELFNKVRNYGDI